MNEKDRLLTEQELIDRLPGVFGTVAGGEPYTARVFAERARASRRGAVRRRLRPGRRRGGEPPRRPGGHGLRHQPRERRRLRVRAGDRPRPSSGAASPPRRRGRLGLQLPSRNVGPHRRPDRPRPHRQGDGAALPGLRHARAGLRHRTRRRLRAASTASSCCRSTTCLRQADIVSVHTPMCPRPATSSVLASWR